MAKYHQLVEVFKEDIEYIKELEKEQEKLRLEMQALDMNDPDELSEVVDLSMTLDEVQAEISFGRHLLSQAIEREYENVPFQKPRLAGIAGFWREAFK